MQIRIPYLRMHHEALSPVVALDVTAERVAEALQHVPGEDRHNVIIACLDCAATADLVRILTRRLRAVEDPATIAEPVVAAVSRLQELSQDDDDGRDMLETLSRIRAISGQALTDLARRGIR